MATVKSLVSRLRIYWTQHATRRDLSHRLHGMSSQELDALIRDIGIPKSELIEEASRPFWNTARFHAPTTGSMLTSRKRSRGQRFKVLRNFGKQKHCSEKSRMEVTVAVPDS